MKCINCGHEWEPGQSGKISACPACGLEAEYLVDIHSYDKAVEAETNGNLAEAIKWYKVAAEEEAPCACYAVYRSMGGKKSQEQEESMFWLWTAAELADPLACYELARVEKKAKAKDVARYYLWKSAQSGHEKACLDLAYDAVIHKKWAEARYYLSNVTESSWWARFLLFLLGKDKKQTAPAPLSYEGIDQKRIALGKYALAGKHEHMAYHLFLLANSTAEGLYLANRLEAEGKGDGVQKTSLTYELLAKAGDMGCLDAYVFLADQLISQTDAPKKYALLAKSFYEKAAAAGHKTAQIVLGHLYYEGESVSPNLELSLHWFEKAALQGDAEAGKWMANISQALSSAEQKARQAYDNGDYTGALKLAVRMADMGHTALSCMAATMFLKGEGCKASPRLAVKYYQKAVEGGSAVAVLRLGLLYAHNHGVRFSYATAQKLLTVASENGYGEAKAQLQLLSERKRAKQLRRVHSTGCSLYHKGLREESIRYFLTAAQLGYAKSMYMLACFAEFGDGMAMDTSVADGWFRKAALAGFDGSRGRIKSGYVRQRKLFF